MRSSVPSSRDSRASSTSCGASRSCSAATSAKIDEPVSQAVVLG
jgi:hypothetical protein